ncbi:MAG: sigma factor-like helix-turn-helix DNA-binding protein [Archangium sp.]
MNVELLEARVRSRWPEFSWDAASFGEFLHARVVRPNDEVAHADDLYLAWACLERQALALAALERELMPAAVRALQRVDASPQFVDEHAARVRERLLVGSASNGRMREPALAGYLGHGPLKSFVMVLAMREAVTTKRRPLVEETFDGLQADRAVSAIGPDTALDANGVRPVLQRALDAALSELEPRLRMVFKLHVLHGVSAQKLAVMYGVHRATTTRWILDARQLLLGSVGTRLREELRLGEETFEGLRGMLAREIEITLSGRLD